MTRMLLIKGDYKEVATEEELLEFANAIRAAGGADVLEALLPSVPKRAGQCLIANALNFSCEVRGLGSGSTTTFDDGVSYRWGMFLPHNITSAQLDALDGLEIDGVELRKCLDDTFYLTLPKHVGNAAEAFDTGVAFTQYARPADWA